MSFSAWISFILVLIGLFIMLVNVKDNFKIHDNYMFLPGKNLVEINKKIQIHRVLMGMFLLGYLFVAIEIVRDNLALGLTLLD